MLVDSQLDLQKKYSSTFYSRRIRKNWKYTTNNQVYRIKQYSYQKEENILEDLTGEWFKYHIYSTQNYDSLLHWKIAGIILKFKLGKSKLKRSLKPEEIKIVSNWFLKYNPDLW